LWDGAVFLVTVAYTGRPGVHNDGDGTTEGWFRSNQPKGDGGFVTTEPVGTEDWMPLNDYPAAKPLRLRRHVVAGKTVSPTRARASWPTIRRTASSRRLGDLALASPAPVASYPGREQRGQLRPDRADVGGSVLPGPGQLAERGAEGQEPR
jgi:hypothetical protein